MTDSLKIPLPTAAVPAANKGLFRFSLLTLLGITTLAALTSAVMFSPHWQADERLLIAFWSGGLILGMSIGQARGKPGVFSGGLGAAVGCLIAIGIREWGGFSLGQLNDSLVAVYLMFVITAGWLSAVIAANIYHGLLTGTVERRWQQRFFRQAVYACAGIVAVALIGWQVLNARPWLPNWKLKIETSRFENTVDVALSPQGDRLLTNVNSRNSYLAENEACQIHDLTVGGVVSRPFLVGCGYEGPVFSPAGSHVAVQHGEQQRVISVANGYVTYGEFLNIRLIEQTLAQPIFSPDGKRLLVTTHSPRIQRLHTIDLATTASPHIELFSFAGDLLVSADGARLIKFYDPQDERNERRVEIVDLETWKTIAQIDDVPQVQKPVFSQDGQRFALSDRIWKLPAGPSRNVGGEVIGLLKNDRALIKQEAVDRWPSWLPDWLHEMPFVRHWHTRQKRSRLCLIDEETGQVRAATSWSTELDRVEMSANERIVAACSRAGQVQIWKVPKVSAK